MRKFLMLFISCVVTVCTYGQAPIFGIKGGGNISTIVNQNSGPAGSKIAYHAGIFTCIPITAKLTMQPEVLYSKQGIRQSLSGENYDINLNYSNITVLIQFLLKKGLMLEAGPQFGFLLSAKNVYQGVEKDIKSNYKSFDISFPIGLCYLWESGFGIDGRWVPGLSEITVTYGSGKNSVFQFGLFYQLSKGNKK